MFIDHKYIEEVLESSKNATKEEIQEVLNRAKKSKGLSHKDIAILLETDNEEQL